MHDATQARLVVLLVGLSQLSELIENDQARAALLARRLESEAQAALEELRALVHGIQPPELTDFGLVHALQGVVLFAPVPVSVFTAGVGRYDGATEDAVYFTCREALQNVIKHAPAATAVTLTLIDRGNQLEFGVEDNGPGFGAALGGAGIASMQSRVEALGGSLAIKSSPSGTRVQGSLPLGH